MEGWIKIHRKILTWEWYQSSDMVHLFLHLILSANRDDRLWQGIKVKRGQVVTGRCSLSRELGISEQKIRSCINRLKSTSEITSKSTNKYSIITICNYEDYQENEKISNQQPNQQHNQQSTTNKNTRRKKKNICSVFNIDYKPINGYDSLAFEFWKQLYDNRIASGIKPTILQRANPEKWSNDIKMIIEKDGRNKEDIKDLLLFLKDNVFWGNNIQSPEKLRSQFENLQLKAKSRKKGKPGDRNPEPVAASFGVPGRKLEEIR